MCTDMLVDASLNEGVDPFDSDPQWLGPARNAEGFRLGEELLRDVLGAGDLAKVISRAEDLQRQLGYVPRGRQRTITFEYREPDFGVTANAAKDGTWRLEIFELEPPDPEDAEFDGRFGRG